GARFDLRPFTPTEQGRGPRVVIHVHLSDQTPIDQHGVVRTEHGPITLDQFRQWLTQADPSITIRPVVDPAATAAVDAYEIPQALRQAMMVRHPGSVWPFSPAATISTGGRCDLDHTIPHTMHGPPGQTSMGNLGPLTRTEHRAKTLGGWRARQPDLGTYLWRSPDGLIAVTTNQGTLLLGDRHWAHQVWTTAESARGAGANR
ncbi:MAG TPA: HNH endonuclease signature motif containing protein, partial [Microlunatus sp.]